MIISWLFANSFESPVCVFGNTLEYWSYSGFPKIPKKPQEPPSFLESAAQKQLHNASPPSPPLYRWNPTTQADLENEDWPLYQNWLFESFPLSLKEFPGSRDVSWFVKERSNWGTAEISSVKNGEVAWSTFAKTDQTGFGVNLVICVNNISNVKTQHWCFNNISNVKTQHWCVLTIFLMWKLNIDVY